MSSMRDHSDKTWLKRSFYKPAKESTFEKFAAVVGICLMLAFVAGLLILPTIR